MVTVECDSLWHFLRSHSADSEIQTFSEILRCVERIGLVVRDVENLKGHSLKTLRRWFDMLA